ncbi:BTB/POZ domain-containing protein 6-like [Montipora foliosa]|uniref:BTB/POZ domain-containing protein 6-like n=1 Tax=Montipora foliosa TaxID=591990 RepID=UPI0035F14F69
MSLDTVVKDFWQLTGRCTIKERCKAIFHQELLSDVKFIVGNPEGECERKSIPCHKFVLAMSSPVFFAMFYGDLAETKDSVEISDCEYESLLEVLRFIYSDELNLNPDNVMQVLYLSKKYMLPYLADKCSAFLEKNLDESNVFYVLHEAQKYEEKPLLDHCWKVIEKDAKRALKSEGFVEIERTVLEELVQNESLNIKEVELFKAVDCWAVNECCKQGIEAEGPVKRRVLGEQVVKAIRFPSMEQMEFADVVLDSGVLTQGETYDLMKYFSSVLKTPVGFPEAKRPGFAKSITRFKSHKSGWCYTKGALNAIVVFVSKDVKLHGVRLFGSDGGQYSVTLTIVKTNGNTIGTQRGTFLSKLVQNEVGQYEGFEIVLATPVTLRAGEHYCFKAEILGPPSRYGENGQTSVDQFGVRFNFLSTSEFLYYWNLRNDSSTIKGQFSEFLFFVE